MAIRLAKILPFYLFRGVEVREKKKKWITFDNLYGKYINIIESRSFVSSVERVFVLRSEL